MLFQFPKNKVLVPYRARHEIGGEIKEGWIGHFEYVDASIVPTRVYLQNPYAEHTCRIYDVDPATYLNDWELAGKPPDPFIQKPTEETKP